MKPLRLVPLASLAAVVGVGAVAFLSDPPLDFPFSEPPEGPPMPQVELTLGSHALVGRVVDDAGEGVDGAGVTTKDGARPVWTWTDADGNFTLDEIEDGPKRVLVTAQDFQSTGFDVPFDASAPEPVVLTLERRIGPPADPPGLSLRDLVGTVDFGALAAPQKGYELLFLPLTKPSDVEGGFPRRVEVDPDGSFEVRLMHEGDYRVILLAPEDRGANAPDLLTTAKGETRTYEHRVDGEAGGLTIVSTAGGVRGTVTFPPSRSSVSAQPERQTVRGALVRVERYADERDALDQSEGEDPPRERTTNLLRDEFRATRTDAEGRYLLRDLPPGRYRLTVVAGRSRRQTDVTIPARTAVDVDLETTR